MFGISDWRGAGSKVRLNLILLVYLGLYLQIIFHELVNFHDSSFITTSVAVIWSREDCDYVSLVCPIVSVHNELMSSRDPCEVVRMIELL